MRLPHRAIILMLLATGLSGCGTINRSGSRDGFGFFNGFWDGLTIVFAWIASWFDSSVALYSWDSNGWYDLGFLIGIALVFGGMRSATSD